LAENLALMRGTAFKAYVDLGSIITEPRALSKIGVRYSNGAGVVRTKHFMPQTPSYLREFLDGEDLRSRLRPLMVVLAQHRANVGAVFLADEPYAHGISKAELERAGQVVRNLLDQRGLSSVKIGVIFASGMFNRGFAHLINERAEAYVHGIDSYYAARGAGSSREAFASWVKTIETHRLVTYDGAGNMYVGGGLPKGFDIYGFDFYLSTLLLDGTHEDTMSWLASRFPEGPCAQFSGETVSEIRGKLSFFNDSKMLTGRKYKVSDRAILDSLFRCRMSAVTAMLLTEKMLANDHADVLIVSESSNNGVLEFTSKGKAKSVQPEALVDDRILDEVNRAERLYEDHPCLYSGGLLFFTYDDSFDKSIKLWVGGAHDVPKVMASIYAFVKKVKFYGTRSGCPDEVKMQRSDAPERDRASN